MREGIGLVAWVLVVGLAGCAVVTKVWPAVEESPVGTPVTTPATPVTMPVEATATVPAAIPETTLAATAGNAGQTAAAATEAAIPRGAEEAVDLCKRDLTHTEGIARETIVVLSVETKRWPDASLGCPKPDMVYAQVITPGFLVVLEARGLTFEYHTDAGRFVLLCQPDD